MPLTNIAYNGALLNSSLGEVSKCDLVFSFQLKFYAVYKDALD